MVTVAHKPAHLPPHSHRMSMRTVNDGAANPIVIAGARASSILQRNVRLHGPALALDGRADTSWSSDSGSPQSLELELASPAHICAIRLAFQGGFVGQRCELWVNSSPVCACARSALSRQEVANTLGMDAGSPATRTAIDWRRVATFEPDDVNAEQEFTVNDNIIGRCNTCMSPTKSTRVRVVFNKSTDFYGRIVVCRLELLGLEITPGARATNYAT